MEEFERKKKYLMHLKSISAIKNGHNRFNLTFSASSKQILKDGLNFNKLCQNRRKLISNRSHISSPNKNKENSLQNYMIEKQNFRLAYRIHCIPSQINLKKYQHQYNHRKKIMRIHQKIKPKLNFYIFKFFDIAFQGFQPDPQQIFMIQEVLDNQRKSILKGNIFELRKIQLKVTNNQFCTLRISSRTEGFVQIKYESLLKIRKNTEVVGNVVLQLLN